MARVQPVMSDERNKSAAGAGAALDAHVYVIREPTVTMDAGSPGGRPLRSDIGIGRESLR